MRFCWWTLTDSFNSGTGEFTRKVERQRVAVQDVNGQKVTLTGLLTAHTALLKSHCRGDNAHSYACVRLFSPRKYESILRGFYNAVSLPGDCHVTLAMTKSALHGKTQAFASNRRTPTLWLGSCPLERTRSQYRMDVDGQNVTLTGLLGIGQF